MGMDVTPHSEVTHSESVVLFVVQFETGTQLFFHPDDFVTVVPRFDQNDGHVLTLVSDTPRSLGAKHEKRRRPSIGLYRATGEGEWLGRATRTWNPGRA